MDQSFLLWLLWFFPVLLGNGATWSRNRVCLVWECFSSCSSLAVSSFKSLIPLKSIWKALLHRQLTRGRTRAQNCPHCQYVLDSRVGSCLPTRLLVSTQCSLTSIHGQSVTDKWHCHFRFHTTIFFPEETSEEKIRDWWRETTYNFEDFVIEAALGNQSGSIIYFTPSKPNEYGMVIERNYLSGRCYTIRVTIANGLLNSLSVLSIFPVQTKGSDNVVLHESQPWRQDKDASPYPSGLCRGWIEFRILGPTCQHDLYWEGFVFLRHSVETSSCEPEEHRGQALFQGWQSQPI